MCNEAARRIELGLLREDWGQTGIPLRFPEGLPNMAPLDGFRITEQTTIIRAAADAPAEAELVTRRWSWPGVGGKPVYNYRSDGRRLVKGRCLIPVDAFYEFTAPEEPSAKRKTKWAFRLVGHDWFCIAGLFRRDPAVGEAFTMLTCQPGPDIAPYHSRQVVVLGREQWAHWLDPRVPSAELTQPLPAGSLTVERVS
jgi:putative SOS response-associated peptidase YedK